MPIIHVHVLLQIHEPTPLGLIDHYFFMYLWQHTLARGCSVLSDNWLQYISMESQDYLHCIKVSWRDASETTPPITSKYTFCRTTTFLHSFFPTVIKLWNTLPHFRSIKLTIKDILWANFSSKFDSLNPCSYCFKCPCLKIKPVII